MNKTASIIVTASVPLVVMAFWPLYFSQPPGSIDPYTHFHAAFGLLWLLLLIIQPLAIQTQRYKLHRFLGRISYLIAATFAVSGVLLSHHRLTSMNERTFSSDGFAHYLPFYATVIFLSAYGSGIWFRREPAVHGRFMLCTAIPLVDPVIGRMLAFYLPPLPNLMLYQVITFSVGTAIAGILVFSFRGPPVGRRALIGYFAMLVLLELGWFVIAPTSIWLDAVRWFRSLPIT